MKDLPKFLFFLILLIYPLFSFIVFEGTGMDPNNVFGFICLIFLIYRLLNIYGSGANLIVPYYVIIFGIFTVYTIVSGIFVSNQLMEIGLIKYLYSNPFLLTFIAFLVVENTDFSQKWISLATKILVLTLMLAAIVSIIQIYDPLFFRKADIFVQGLSSDRLSEYYKNNPQEELNGITLFLEGYRFSIYSFINDLSVGIDTIAIFSLLFALKSNSQIKTITIVIAAALVSFLSSSRWIMLNFLVVASQGVWTSENKFSKGMKYSLYFIILLLFMIPILEFSGIDIQRFVQERLMSKSASTRLLAVEVFSRVYPDNPIFGTGGVDTQKMIQLIGGRSSQIHVGYLKLFYYYGLVGGLLYLTFLASFLTRLWKMARQSSYWGGFFAILAFAIANLTLVELNLFYYGLLLALIFSNHFYYKASYGFHTRKTKKN